MASAVAAAPPAAASTATAVARRPPLPFLPLPVSASPPRRRAASPHSLPLRLSAPLPRCFAPFSGALFCPRCPSAPLLVAALQLCRSASPPRRRAAFLLLCLSLPRCLGATLPLCLAVVLSRCRSVLLSLCLAVILPRWRSTSLPHYLTASLPLCLAAALSLCSSPLCPTPLPRCPSLPPCLSLRASLCAPLAARLSLCAALSLSLSLSHSRCRSASLQLSASVPRCLLPRYRALPRGRGRSALPCLALPCLALPCPPSSLLPLSAPALGLAASLPPPPPSLTASLPHTALLPLPASVLHCLAATLPRCMSLSTSPRAWPSPVGPPCLLACPRSSLQVHCNVGPCGPRHHKGAWRRRGRRRRVRRQG